MTKIVSSNRLNHVFWFFKCIADMCFFKFHFMGFASEIFVGYRAVSIFEILLNLACHFLATYSNWLGQTWSGSKSWPTSCEGRRVEVHLTTRPNCLLSFGWYAYIYWISTLLLLNFLMFPSPLCTHIKHKYIFGKNIIKNSKNLNCYIMLYSPI